MKPLLLTLLGCGSLTSELEEAQVPDSPVASFRDLSPDAAPAPAEADGEGLSDRREGRVGIAKGERIGLAETNAAVSPEPDDAEASAEARSWFPEAFLWRPLVETGEDGVAQIDIRVPDQLSTFRVLALAHDRRGQQAGDIHQFQTRLPVYVQPVMPDRLYAGDRIELPVQVVNGSSRALTAALSVEASGALQGAGSARVRLSAGSSDVRRIRLLAEASGAATVRASLEGGEYVDIAERRVEVLPQGRPMVTTVSRRLSSDPFTLSAPSRADRSTEQIDVVVFGGPWSVLQAEVERLAAGARPVDPAYGFALSARVAALAEVSGVAIDAERHKILRVHAWQQLAHEAQRLEPARAAELLTSLQEVEGDDLVDALLPDLVRTIRKGQRADGTWSRTERSTLQQVLVQTAFAARALPLDERGSRVRAAGAIERSLAMIDDPYTASVVLASGLVPTDSQERLREVVREGIENGRLVVPATVRNARGEPPRAAEGLAWAILALEPGDELAGALVAELLGMWRVEHGFCAGAADSVALDAIARALPPASQPIALSLRRGAQIVATASLDPAQPRVPARFTVRPSASTSTLSLTAEPSAPGLVMVATRRSWVPWRSTDRIAGIDVDVRLDRLEAGRLGTLRLALAGPSGAELEVRQPTPAGVTVPGPGTASRGSVDVFVDEIVVSTPPLSPGEVIEVEVPVVASFAGRFSTGPLRVSVDGATATDLPPVTWSVSR